MPLPALLAHLLTNLSQHFGVEIKSHLSEKITDNSHFNQFVETHQLSDKEQLLLTVAVLPYLDPSFFNELNEQVGGSLVKPSLLFYQEPTTGVLLPLLQVALLIVYPDAGWQYALKTTETIAGKLFKTGILNLQTLSNNEQKNNPLLQLLEVDSHYFAQLFNGQTVDYQLSSQFPARKISTVLTWDHLILEPDTREQVDDIVDWHRHQKELLKNWGLGSIVKPGYRVLFYGPSGTGKTLTASLMGQRLGLDVYRVDLSLVISKYIGETEKNLSQLFAKAENKDWILFFDEADALFGSRTGVRDAHDRYANQEVSYLLQRIEEFEGIVILASNLKHNIDKAFARRFQAMVEFRIPKVAERERLWRQALVKAYDFIPEIARKYEVTGGTIVNVVQYATLKARQRENRDILLTDIQRGIARELWKEGKTP
ncbi:ATP-binding protein [Larkinella rosea]|uniref:ATP-binding protein n=1 Tax=Larkinella rosea TaxID=2025312 RepID=A0A3P1C398_9BACT|nr:ATP-binding protein [Larkinella rosea]RRB07768.1 ATP-binding protein [Larkinella rosea]